MSTEDDRRGTSGGYADSGYFTTGQTSGDAAYSSGQTDILPGSGGARDDHYDDDYDDHGTPGTAREPHAWHFGADLGLLVLRVTLGALFVGHGLQKVFGIMQGPGIDGFAKMLGDLGYQQTTLLSWITGVTELAGGTLLVFGLFTPAAAAAILGVMANVIWLKVDPAIFAGGVELESVNAAAAFCLLFTGAGRISLDRNTPWFRRAPAFGFLFLILAAAGSVVTLVVLR